MNTGENLFFLGIYQILFYNHVLAYNHHNILIIIITFDRLYNHDKGQRELLDADKLIARRKSIIKTLSDGEISMGNKGKVF